MTEKELRQLNRNGVYPAFAYIMKIVTEKGYIWTKIGMTTKTPEERARGIKRAGVKGHKYFSVDCEYYIPCKSKRDAEHMENVLRSVLTLIDPRKFMAHDRFAGYKEDYITYIIVHPDVRRNAREFGVKEWVDENLDSLI